MTTRVDSAWELPPITDTSAREQLPHTTPPANRQAVFDSLKTPSLGPVIAKQQQMQDIVNNACRTLLQAGRRSGSAEQRGHAGHGPSQVTTRGLAAAVRREPPLPSSGDLTQ